jgi:hypothetical protein
MYRTMVLEMIQHQPSLHDRLRREGCLLATVDRLGAELRDRHLGLKQSLTEAHPDRDPDQVSQEAMEIALAELGTSLPTASPNEDPDAAVGP